MMESETWWPNVGFVKARQLKEDNLEQIARWCNGRVRGKLLPREQQIVQIDLSRGGEDEGRIGEWIILDSTMEFRVLTDELFRKSHTWAGPNV